MVITVKPQSIIFGSKGGGGNTAQENDTCRKVFNMSETWENNKKWKMWVQITFFFTK